ncbi:TPA: hypothetical protein ACPJ07_004521 [Vibrio diabolicus]|uniref:hypothetical protein n=1 Tax=Vibrio diabolicus TaxID=50719 RepID=UPI00215FFF19|nr:hypothetical protein [Vibrio diabolicus]MCS0342413.1 hypothetical protein [Vibrio diabolicus]
MALQHQNQTHAKNATRAESLLNALLVAKPKVLIEVNYLFANTSFMYFKKLKSGAVSKRLSLKPLGTRNAVENELTTPKRPFGETMPQS